MFPWRGDFVRSFIPCRKTSGERRRAVPPLQRPVEAKSGKSFAVKSLHNFKDKFTNRVGLQYVLHDGDIQREGEIVYLPYYMASVL